MAEPKAPSDPDTKLVSSATRGDRKTSSGDSDCGGNVVQLNVKPIQALKPGNAHTKSPPPRRTSPAYISSNRVQPLTPIITKGSAKSTSPADSKIPLITTSTASPTTTSSPVLRPCSSASLHTHSLTASMEASRAPRAVSSPRGRAGSQTRSVSLPGGFRNTTIATTATSNQPPTGPSSSPSSGLNSTHSYNINNRRSVKHLTCFWWKQRGNCRYSDEDCLYAHHDTGLYTDPPRQLIPGEPAMAGRALDRALRKLHIDHHNKSSSSLSTMAYGISRPTTPVSYSTAITGGAENHAGGRCDVPAAHDVRFLRELVEQGSKEKAALLSTIEALQAENKSLKQENDSLKTERQTVLLQDRHVYNASQCYSTNPTRQHLARPAQNPFGVIGGNTRPAPTSSTTPSPTTQLQNENSELKNILRNYGMSF